MKSAADYVGEKVGSMPGAETVQRTSAAAADSAAATVDYLRDADMQSMAHQVEAMVKKNPGPALLVAVGLGFLLGRSMNR